MSTITPHYRTVQRLLQSQLFSIDEYQLHRRPFRSACAYPAAGWASVQGRSLAFPEEKQRNLRRNRCRAK